MANTIILKRKSTTGAPTAGQLEQGELAINLLDEKLYSKNSSNAIFEITDHDNLTNYVANEHIDWTSATQNFSTSGTITGVNVTSGSDPGHTHTAYAASSHTHTFDSLTSKTSGTGNYQTTGDMIADNFEATGLGPNATPGTDDLYIGGYGILGDRATAVYVSNVSGPVVLNHTGVHNTNTKLATTSTGVTVTGTMAATTVTGANVTSGTDPGHTHSAYLTAESDTLATVTGRGATTATASTFSGGINMSDSDLNRPVLEDYAVKHQTLTINTGTTPDSATVNCTLGNSAYLDLENAVENIEVFFTNPPASGRYGEINLTVQQGTTARTITWPSSVDWKGATPVLTTTNNAIDVFNFYTIDGGTTWIGTYALDGAAATGATVLDDLNDVTLTTPADGAVMIYDTGTSQWRDFTLSGDVTMTDSGVTTVADNSHTHLIANITDFTDNSTNWDAAYNDKINSASFNTGSGVLTLTQQDAGTVTVDLDGRYYKDEGSLNGSDLDTIDTQAENGLYRWTTTATNEPFNYGGMLALWDGGQTIQLAFGNSSFGRLSVRRKDSGVWYAWTNFVSIDQGHTPVSNRVALWHTATEQDSSANLTFDGSTLNVTGTVAATTVTGANVTSGTDPGHTHSAYLTSAVTSVAAGNGMDFTTITGTGSVTMGTPGSLSGSTTNAVTATSHTHAISSITAAKILAGSLVSGVNSYFTASTGNSSYKIPFMNYTGTASTNASMLHDSGATFTYNPSTNTLAVSNINMADGTLDQPVLQDYAIESVSYTPTGTTQTLTYSNGPAFEVDLESVTGNATITLSGGPPTGTYGQITVKVTQDSATARTVTWAGGTFEWAGGTAHPVTTTLNGFTIFTFETWDGGTTWFGGGADYS